MTQWFDLWNERFDNPLKDAESFMVDNNGYLTEIEKKIQTIVRFKANSWV